MQQKKDLLAEILADKEATKKRESIAKKAAAQEANKLEEATAEKEQKISNTEAKRPRRKIERRKV